ADAEGRGDGGARVRLADGTRDREGASRRARRAAAVDGEPPGLVRRRGPRGDRYRAHGERESSEAPRRGSRQGSPLAARSYTAAQAGLRCRLTIGATKLCQSGL